MVKISWLHLTILIFKKTVFILGVLPPGDLQNPNGAAAFAALHGAQMNNYIRPPIQMPYDASMRSATITTAPPQNGKA